MAHRKIPVAKISLSLCGPCFRIKPSIGGRFMIRVGYRDMTRRTFIASVGTAATIAAQNRLSAVQVVERIKEKLAAEGVVWGPSSFDGFHLGNPDALITGVATTFQPTLDVLQRAAATGKNLVISHES